MTVGKPYSPYRVFTGIVIPEGLLQFPDISLGAKVTLARLWRYCGKRHYCWPTQQELAEQLCFSERSIRTYIGELEKEGFITIKQQGLQRPNMYCLLGHKALMSEEFELGTETYEDPPEDVAGPSGKVFLSGRQKLPVGAAEIAAPLKDLGILTESSTESYTESNTPTGDQHAREASQAETQPISARASWDVIQKLWAERGGRKIENKKAARARTLTILNIVTLDTVVKRMDEWQHGFAKSWKFEWFLNTLSPDIPTPERAKAHKETMSERVLRKYREEAARSAEQHG